MKPAILYRGIILCFLILCAAHFSFAQTDTARLQGTITDPNGGAVNGASVTVKSIETGRTTPTSTNELGYYTVPALPPGNYRIEITQKGFKKEVRELELQVAQVGVADFQLQIGDVTQSVVVEAGSPVINPADSAIGDVVESRQVTELPLNGRNFTQLATLIPGVTRGVPTGSATGSGNNAETFRDGETGGASLSVNGLRPQNNNFTLDGIDNNEALVNTIVFFPSADAIDEFRVQTSVAPAEFGRAGGALIITSLKSGTNSWHGSAFEFNRTTSLQARDFFVGPPTPAYNRNQFPPPPGGPIIKNKLFVFGDYQGLRKQIPGSNDVATVPTDLMRKGDFSELLCTGNPGCAGTGLSSPVQVLDPTTGTQFMGSGAQPNVIPAARINQVGMAYLNAYPEPNCTAAIDTRCHSILQNYHNTRHIIENWNDFDVRGDYIYNQSNSFFLRFSRGRADQTESTRLTTLPSGFGSGTNFNHPYGTSIGWTDIIKPTIINEARVGFVRTFYGFEPPFSGTDICTNLGIPNCNTPLLGGNALIGGFNNQIEFTGDFGPFLVPQTGYNANDSVSWTKGKHTFKFGANVIRRQLNLYRPLAGKGFFALSGNGNAGQVNTNYEISDLLAGFVNNYSHGTNFGDVGTRSWENGFFIQDDWRVTPRLTLNLGLRYDILTWPVEVNDRQANFNVVTGALDVANQNGNSRSLIDNNYNNFGPRVGFAYQLTNDGKTVVRGGFGIFYFLDRGGISNQLAQNPPFSGENTVTYSAGFRITLSGSLACEPTCTAAQLNATQATGPLPSGNFTNLNLAAPSGVSVISALSNNATPRVTQYNLQVQREVGVNSSVSLAYVGTSGRFLTRNYNQNEQFFGVSNSDPNHDLFPALGSVTVQDNHGNSSYNSLQAEYERRFTKGLQFLGAFTWSKTIDDACGDLDNCSPQFFRNFSIERGRSNIDQPYRLVLSSLYELPIGRGKRFGSGWSRPVDWALGGWQLNGIYTLQAGLPFNVTVDGNPGSDRADLVGKPSVNTGFSPGASGKPYLTPAAFALPAATLFADGSIVFNAPGTGGRNILRGPGSSNIDLALFKNIQLTERIKTELRVQAYNLTNTPHFANPNSDLGGWTTQNCVVADPQPCVLVNGVSKQLTPNPNAQFGQVNGTQPFSYRQVELGLRFIF